MFIEFSELNFKLLVMLIFPAFNIAEHYARSYFITKDNSYFSQFRYFTSHILSFILVIISHYKNKSKVINLEQINENINDNNLNEENEMNISFLNPKYSLIRINI